MVCNEHETSVGSYLEDFPISNVLEALRGHALVELCTKEHSFKQSILNCIQQCPVYTKSQIGKQAICQWQEQFVFLNALSRFLSSKSSLIGIELPADAAAAVMGACLKREDIETASDPEMKKNRNSSE